MIGHQNLRSLLGMIHHDDNFAFLYKTMDPILETKKIGSGYTDGSAQILRYFITR